MQDAFRAVSLVGDLGGTAAAEAEALLEGACFVGGTPVRTLTGTDTIDDVEVGDVVLAFEPTWRGVRQDRPPLSTVVLALGLGALPLASVAPAERFVWAGVVWELDGDTLVGTGEVAGTVVATSVHAATALVDVVVVSTAGGEEVVSATAEHPFYVEGVGWVAAGSLAPGDELTFAGQGRAWVVATTVRHGRFEVYNFEVADAHTYFVGADGAVLVHNGCAVGGARVTGDALAQARREFEAAKKAWWRREVGVNPETYSADDVARLAKGQGPIGPDGYPMELHHKIPLAEGGTNAPENLVPMTRTEHRLGDAYKTNHPNLP